MKELLISNCEKEFILNSINNKQRIDARPAFDYRPIEISFGSDDGCCQVKLGDTRVFAQVTAELGTPRVTRPKDGVIHVNLDLSPMASPYFEAWRMSDEAVELNRLLERCIKESTSIDTESLCVIAGEKVWVVRVTVTVLNHHGNMLDCACIAAVTALSHFRRNEVTVDHKIITILPKEERNAVPLNVIHRPLCVTFAFFMHGKFMVVDPGEREEAVMEGRLVVGVNRHREVCTLQATGTMLLTQQQILRCVNMATVKVKEITDKIDAALSDDVKSRAAGIVNFSHKHTRVPAHAVLVPLDLEKSDVTAPSLATVTLIDDNALVVDHQNQGDSEMRDEDDDEGGAGVGSDAEMELRTEQSATSRVTTASSSHPQKTAQKHTAQLEGVDSGSEEEPVMLQSLDTTPEPVAGPSQVTKQGKKKSRSRKNRKKGLLN